MLQEYKYLPADMWNIDKLGFSIGEEQAIKVLIYLNGDQKYKVIRGKQEWVIVIKCINAAGEVLALLVIFKGQNVNTR